MLDRIFATISMLGVIAFMGVVVVFVREPDLIIVTVTVLIIGIIYVWRDLRSDGSRLENQARNDKSGD